LLLIEDTGIYTANILRKGLENNSFLNIDKSFEPITKDRFDKFAEDYVKIFVGDLRLYYFSDFAKIINIKNPKFVKETEKSIAPSLRLQSDIEASHNPSFYEYFFKASTLGKMNFMLTFISDKKEGVIRVLFGDLHPTYHEGIQLFCKIYGVQTDLRADIVIVSPGGYPTDLNLFQASKSIEKALLLTKRGGTIILVAECQQGYGNKKFYDLVIKLKGHTVAEKSNKHHLDFARLQAFKLIKALQKVQLFLVSSIPDYYAINAFNFKTAKNVNEALNAAISFSRKRPKILALSYGNLMALTVKKD
jgi:nickel-dependent lactate racemase